MPPTPSLKQNALTLVGAVGLCVLNAFSFAKLVDIYGDALYFESFYQHVVVRGDRPDRFWFTEALFFFPDFAAMFPIRMASANAAWSIVAYVFIGSLLQATMLWALFKRLWAGTSRGPLDYLLGLSVAFALSATSDICRLFGNAPNHHASVWFLFVFWLFQIDDLAKPGDAAGKRPLWLWLALDLVLGFGFAFSDPVSFTEVLAPAALLVALMSAAGLIERSVGARVVVTTAIAAIGGWLAKTDLTALGLLISPTDVGVPSGHELYRSFLRFDSSVLEVLWSGRWILGAFAAALAACFALRRRRPEGPLWPAAFRNLSILAAASGVAATLATARWADLNSARYALAAFFAPLIWLAVWAIPSFRLPRAAKISGFCLVVGAWIAALAAAPAGYRMLDEPPIASCLDGLSETLPTPWGFSNFWIAKAVTFTSRARIVANQLGPDLSIYPWMNGPDWYRRDAYGRRIDRYSFYIPANSPSEIAAARLWGQPDERVTCQYGKGVVDVMIYRDGIAPFVGRR